MKILSIVKPIFKQIKIYTIYYALVEKKTQQQLNSCPIKNSFRDETVIQLKADLCDIVDSQARI